MAIVSRPQVNAVTVTLKPLTALNLYLERVKSVTDSVRLTESDQDYIPFQLGGLSGQQQSLTSNAVIGVVDFNLKDQ